MSEKRSNTSKKSTRLLKNFAEGLQTSAKDKIAAMTSEERQDILMAFRRAQKEGLINF